MPRRKSQTQQTPHVRKRRRPIYRFTKSERTALKTHFGTGDYWPTKKVRDGFAKQFSVDSSKIQIWFQNYRAKMKRIKTSTYSELCAKHEAKVNKSKLNDDTHRTSSTPQLDDHIPHASQSRTGVPDMSSMDNVLPNLKNAELMDATIHSEGLDESRTLEYLQALSDVDRMNTDMTLGAHEQNTLVNKDFYTFLNSNRSARSLQETNTKVDQDMYSQTYLEDTFRGTTQFPQAQSPEQNELPALRKTDETNRRKYPIRQCTLPELPFGQMF